jgi:hypothetical protein
MAQEVTPPANIINRKYYMPSKVTYFLVMISALRSA